MKITGTIGTVPFEAQVTVGDLGADWAMSIGKSWYASCETYKETIELAEADLRAFLEALGATITGETE